MKLFDLTVFVLSLFDLVRKDIDHAFNCLPFPRAHLRWVQLTLGCDLLHRLVTAQRLKRYSRFNLFEKFRRFVILVSIRSCWIHLSTLSSFTGPLQCDVD